MNQWEYKVLDGYQIPGVNQKQLENEVHLFFWSSYLNWLATYCRVSNTNFRTRMQNVHPPPE